MTFFDWKEANRIFPSYIGRPRYCGSNQIDYYDVCLYWDKDTGKKELTVEVCFQYFTISYKHGFKTKLDAYAWGEKEARRLIRKDCEWEARKELREFLGYSIEDLLLGIK